MRVLVLKPRHVVNTTSKFRLVFNCIDFYHRARQCLLFTRSHECKSPFGERPINTSVLIAARTSYPSRATIKLSLDTSRRTGDIHMQLFCINDITSSRLIEALNALINVCLGDIYLNLTFAY